MFVAYTGYGRIATLAEEVHQPRRTIPLAILLTLLVSMILYGLVGMAGIGAAGSQAFAHAGMERAAPLEVLTRRWASPLAARVVALGAITAMLGVLLNLILGLSRVVLAMARRGEMPRSLAGVSESTGTPSAAVILVAAAILGLVAIGDVKTTWSFSAFTVLIYYAVTNLAALRLGRNERLFPPLFAWAGLIACLFLAFWVQRHIWIAGCGLIALGLVWHFAAGRLHVARDRRSAK
jgi:APA family basic amino acid/polyamine antiporter